MLQNKTSFKNKSCYLIENTNDLHFLVPQLWNSFFREAQQIQALPAIKQAVKIFSIGSFTLRNEYCLALSICLPMIYFYCLLFHCNYSAYYCFTLVFPYTASWFSKVSWWDLQWDQRQPKKCFKQTHYPGANTKQQLWPLIFEGNFAFQNKKEK